MQTKLKVCSCTPSGTITFYQNSRGKQLRTPRTFINDLQLYGNFYQGHSKQTFENNRYNYQQIFLYERCVYGTKACSESELANMSFKEKMRLNHKYKKTQQLINLCKWKATSDLVKETFNKTFPRLCPWIHTFLNSTNEILDEDDMVLNTSSIKSIGGRTKLIEKMIENKLLPSNFYNLKTA